MSRSHQEVAIWRSALPPMLAWAWLFCGGCTKEVPRDALVLTQVPQAGGGAAEAANVLDARYSAGSRVVLGAPPFDREWRVLSQGLHAAGDPVVSYDGERVAFAGKAGPANEWQIYEVAIRAGQPRQITAQHGGAMEPAFLPNGDVVFVSPVPRPGAGSQLPALYAISPGGNARQLTFSTRAVRAPTLLSDGRILFVSEEASAIPDSAPRRMLYTINNDGTELTAFAAPIEGVTSVERPRQLPDGLVVFVTKTDERPGGSAEFVRLDRPFQKREPLLAKAGARVCSVEPASDGGLLLCASRSTSSGSSWEAFRVKPGAGLPSEAALSLPGWNTLEAVKAAPSDRPMGRLSMVDQTKSTGQILCLDANSTRYPAGQPAAAHASRIRVLTDAGGKDRVLGEVPLQADGSFLVEVPANAPLGFEALDEKGSVLRRVPPIVWVRPGENRSCNGCHAPPHYSPENHRPLAVNSPAPRLGPEDPRVAKK